MKLAVMMLSFAFGLQTMACTMDGKEGFLPENDLNIPVGLKLNYKTITEAEFNEVIDLAEKVYAPIIAAKGGKLKVKRLWDNGTVNASAQRSGSTYVVNMYGGLARHKEATKDAFAMVLCHELGHHLGGIPKTGGSAGGWGGGAVTSWASNEGQSDYFASLKCMRLIYKGDNNKELMKAANVPKAVAEKCAASFGKDSDEAYMCQRSSMAGLALARLLGSLRSGSKMPDFNTPDTKVVSKTYNAHPEAQCRLDTYFAGAICDVSETVDVSNTDANAGVCARTRNYKEGVRPLCWFKPTAE